METKTEMRQYCRDHQRRLNRVNKLPRKPCECGCGELIPIVNTNNKPARFKLGHHVRIMERTIEHRQRIAQALKGENNGMWVGDTISYSALHDWIKRNIPKPEFCQICNKSKPYDAHNISGKYLRDLNDWQWLCRRCHMVSDGRMERWIQGNPMINR